MPWTRTKAYYHKMIDMCFDINHKQYHMYGAVGISTDLKWKLNCDSFYEDMGKCPENLRLCRKDRTKNFNKENCYWGIPESKAQHKKTYDIWCRMKQKCNNPNNTSAIKYKEINVCVEWENNYKQFENDMGIYPGKGQYLCRKDHSKDFNKENCYWSELNNVVNNRTDNVLLTLDGETKTAVEWSIITGIEESLIRQRKHKLGWSDAKNLTTPTRKLKGDDGEYLPKRKTQQKNKTLKLFDPEKIYYVYHILHPLTEEVKYVGKGKGTRCYEHLRDKGSNAHNARLNGWTRNFVEINFPPIIVKIVENISEQEAYDMEEREILKHGRLGYDSDGTLFNVLENGSPPVLRGKDSPWYGRKHTQESKDKISKANTGNPNKNKGKTGIYSEESLRKMSEAKKGKIVSQETTDKRIATRKANAIPQSEHQKKVVSELMAKKYIVTDPNGVEYNVTNLLQFCLATPELGKNANANLTNVASGKLNHYKKWKARRVE